MLRCSSYLFHRRWCQPLMQCLSDFSTNPTGMTTFRYTGLFDYCLEVMLWKRPYKYIWSFTFRVRQALL